MTCVGQEDVSLTIKTWAYFDDLRQIMEPAGEMRRWSADGHAGGRAG
jgi:hypothetical protein